MLPRSTTALPSLLLALAAISATRPAPAQQGNTPLVKQVQFLNGPWRVHAGDDPQWASPAVDDRGWQQIDLGSAENKNLSAQGILWFRTRIPAQNPPADTALLVAPLATGCQVFVNGSRVADCNQLHGPNYYISRGIFIRLAQSSTDSPLLLAIRLEHPGKAVRLGDVGLGKDQVLFGSQRLLSYYRTARDAERFYRVLPQSLLCVGELLGGIVLLLAFAFDRSSREYLWFAAFLWVDGAASLMSCFDSVYPVISPAWQDWLNAFGLIGRYAPLVGFLAAFTKSRTNWAVRGYQIVLLLAPEAFAALHFYGPDAVNINWTYLLLSFQLPFVVGSIVFLAVKWRRGSRDGALLLPSFLLANGIEVLGLTGIVNEFHFGPRFHFNWDDLSMFFFLISIAPVIIARHRRVTMEHLQTSAELEAAREVQAQLIVPAVDVSGFKIESAYAPAKHVGGDFFRVMPGQDGSVLIVVGDVSGKGLKAAMTVSAIMGSLHDYPTTNPSEVLAHLNRILHGRVSGFVTCCAANIAADGTMALANAGNPAPYLNGEEMAVEPGLPLGLLEEVNYRETRYQIAPGDRLTFVSDGVLEATNAKGELFGFARAQAISPEPAEKVAQAAQAFGQEDDITVLTLMRENVASTVNVQLAAI